MEAWVVSVARELGLEVLEVHQSSSLQAASGSLRVLQDCVPGDTAVSFDFARGSPTMVFVVVGEGGAREAFGAAAAAGTTAGMGTAAAARPENSGVTAFVSAVRDAFARAVATRGARRIARLLVQDAHHLLVASVRPVVALPVGDPASSRITAVDEGVLLGRAGMAMGHRRGRAEPPVATHHRRGESSSLSSSSSSMETDLDALAAGHIDEDRPVDRPDEALFCHQLQKRPLAAVETATSRPAPKRHRAVGPPLFDESNQFDRQSALMTSALFPRS